jgi:hypothetical protein
MLTYATQERGKVARTYAQRMRRLGGHVTDFLKEKARRYLGATRENVRIDMTRNAGIFFENGSQCRYFVFLNLVFF